MPRIALLLSLLIPTLAAAAAQESPEEQARRLLEDGRSYWAQGKLKQALDNFDIVVGSFAGTEAVGQALLEIGRYRLEVDGDFDKARAAFEQVTREHARSDAAPGAYYYLGRLTLERAATPAEIDDALAQFTRVETLYPRSSAVPRALQASAMAHRRAGRYAEAAELNRRVSLEYPASDAAAVAQFEVGRTLALQGQARQAMEEFQQVRNRFPQTEWAALALDRITALYRLAGTAKPSFTLDPTFTAGAGDVLKDVRALLFVPGGSLWIASGRTKSAVQYEGGKIAGSITADEPRALTLGPRGEVVLSAATAVRIGLRDVRSVVLPPEKPGSEPKPLTAITAAALVPGGSLLVADDDRERVFRFDAAGRQFLGTFPASDTAKRKVTRLHVDAEGGIFALDREQRTVSLWDQAGKQVRSFGPAGLKKPVDFAVDPFRNVYVADEEMGVVVFDPKGTPLLTLAHPDVRRPKALTLDAAGAVLVYDDRASRIFRYR